MWRVRGAHVHEPCSQPPDADGTAIHHKKIQSVLLPDRYSHCGVKAVGSRASGGLLVVEVLIMKRTVAVLGVLAAASVTPAVAADLSRPVYKAPPPVTVPAQVYSWTGFYIGGHAGAG